MDRPMMKVSWTEHKTNEQILHTVETERELINTVRFPHILIACIQCLFPIQN